METLETAGPVGTTIKRFSEPNSLFKFSIVDLIKSVTIAWFHWIILFIIFIALYIQLQIFAVTPKLVLLFYRKDHIWYFLLLSSRLLLIAFAEDSGMEGLHGQLFWSHKWNIYPVWTCDPIPFICRNISFIRKGLGDAMAFVSPHSWEAESGEKHTA